MHSLFAMRDRGATPQIALAMGRRLYGTGSSEIFTILSLPHRLHLIGRSLTSVVGSNHNTVCLPHTGQRKRRWFILFSLSCCLSPKCYHPVYSFLCKGQIKKPAPESLIAIHGTGSKAQAQIQFYTQSLLRFAERTGVTGCFLLISNYKVVVKFIIHKMFIYVNFECVEKQVISTCFLHNNKQNVYESECKRLKLPFKL